MQYYFSQKLLQFSGYESNNQSTPTLTASLELLSIHEISKSFFIL